MLTVSGILERFFSSPNIALGIQTQVLNVYLQMIYTKVHFCICLDMSLVSSRSNSSLEAEQMFL